MTSRNADTWSGSEILDDVRRVLEEQTHRSDAFQSAAPRRPAGRGGRSLRFKVTALVLAAVALPMIASAAFVHQSFTDSAARSAENSASELTNTIAANFDRFVTDVERYTFLPVSDDRILRILQAHADTDTDTGHVPLTSAERTDVEAALLPVRLDSRDIRDLRVFTLDGSAFSSWDYWSSAAWDQEGEAPWMRQADAADGAVVFVSPDADDPEGPAVGLARLIREPLTHRALGYVLIDIDVAVVESLVAPAGGESVIELVDTVGRTFFASGSHAPDVRTLSLTAPAPSARFSVVAAISLALVQSDAAALARAWIAVGALAVAAACIGASLVTRRMLHPVEALRDTMRRVAQGHSRERAAIGRPDEIGMLGVSLNSMLDQIDTLVTDLRQMATREREAAIWALQGQMNPHFLFNSLEMVNMLAVQRRDWEISDAIARVGRLFRYMIDLKSPEVTLAEELGFVSNWVDVYAANRDAAVDLAIDVPADHLATPIPKFVLQPLVENAMLHSPADGPRTVSISSTVRGGELVVAVDNLAGVTDVDTEVERANQSLQGGDRPVQGGDRPMQGARGAGGNGLVNVHRRVQLHHGSEYGLRARCYQGRFIVEVRLPYQRSANYMTTMP